MSFLSLQTGQKWGCKHLQKELVTKVIIIYTKGTLSYCKVRSMPESSMTSMASAKVWEASCPCPSSGILWKSFFKKPEKKLLQASQQELCSSITEVVNSPIQSPGSRYLDSKRGKYAEKFASISLIKSKEPTTLKSLKKKTKMTHCTWFLDYFLTNFIK